MWNSRPINPVFSPYVLPPTKYTAFVGEGAYSTGVFRAKPTDGPITIADTWSADDETHRSVTIAHWPAEVAPATGTDGHAEIVDTMTGIIHSFWRLQKKGQDWTAALYAWSPLTGSGWGDPAHYYQGARAAGVPTLGGLIRKHEVNDGEAYYHHALAVSLDNSAFKSGYIFPATSEDGDGSKTYAGGIPMGALLMLPPDFDVASIKTAELRKVAETLKLFGARVVDRNQDTRFSIYVENGSGFSIHKNRWNSTAANDLDLIASDLRAMTSNSGYISGTGQEFTPSTAFNLASMRGPWTLINGAQPGTFDTWRQALVFPPSREVIVQEQRSPNWHHEINWSPWQPGKMYRFSVHATGAAQARLLFRGAEDGTDYDSGAMGDGASTELKMPADVTNAVLVASSGGKDQPSTVRVQLIECCAQRQDASRRR